MKYGDALFSVLRKEKEIGYGGVEFFLLESEALSLQNWNVVFEGEGK